MVAVFTVKPNNCKDFLGIDENKTDLFAFLSPKLFVFPWHCRQMARNCMHQTEVELSALLLSHTALALLHVRKRRLTLVYVCLWQVMCEWDTCRKVTIRTIDTHMAVLTVASFSKTAPMSFGLPLASVQTFRT